MENPAEFNLNAALSDWRRRLSDSSALRHENLEELEAHLRDSVASIQTRGLTEEEAFLIASQRLGNTRTLSAEYAKVHRKDLWLERLLWMVAGILGWTVANELSRVIADNAVILGLAALRFDFVFPTNSIMPFSGWMIALLMALAQLLVLILVCVAGWRLMNNKRAATAIQRPLRHRLALGLAVVPFVGVLTFSILAYARVLLVMKLFTIPQFGAIGYSTSVAAGFMSLFSSAALSAALVWLARRRVQLRRAT